MKKNKVEKSAIKRRKTQFVKIAFKQFQSPECLGMVKFLNHSKISGLKWLIHCISIGEKNEILKKHRFSDRNRQMLKLAFADFNLPSVQGRLKWQERSLKQLQKPAWQ